MTGGEAHHHEETPDNWWEQIGEPDDDPYSSVTPEERQESDLEDFWKTRPVLEHIHTFARSRLVAPWAVFGAVLARVVTATPPSVQLPPVTGGHASLNLFVALVGPSGDGKDAAQKVARDCFDLGGDGFLIAPLGSGEGLSHMFMRDTKEGPEQHNSTALVTIGEIDTLGALKGRQASTLMPQLRQAAMGEQLGFFYVDTTRRMMVPEHRYRLCLVAGVQPKRSASILDDADGGTPQRFVWLPTADPSAPDVEPEEPEPMRWIRPAWQYAPREYHDQADRYTMRIPDEVKEIIKQALRDRRRGNGDALDGHALLTREKVACALTILDGRTEMVMADWDLAGVAMRVSDRCRAACVAAMVTTKREANRAAAIAEGERSVVVRDALDQAKLKRVCGSVRRLLARHGPLSSAALRRQLASENRSHLETAVDHLVATGDITATDAEYRGQKGKIYALS